MKDYKNLIILGLLIIVALFVFNKCNGKDKEKSDKAQFERDLLHSKNTLLEKRIREDSLRIVALNQLQATSEIKTDSLDSKLKESKRSYYALANKIRNGFPVNICDTIEIIQVLNECDSAIVNSDRTIAQRDTTIKILKETVKEQVDMVAAAREEVSNKDKEIVILDKELKRVKRRNKIKTALIIIADVVKDGLLIFALK